jgi:hypothetical protein
MSSIKLAALLVLSTILGCAYMPVVAFIAKNISELARAVGGVA